MFMDCAGFNILILHIDELIMLKRAELKCVSHVLFVSEIPHLKKGNHATFSNE